MHRPRFRKTATGVRLTSDDGVSELWLAAPTILMQTAYGHLDGAIGRGFVEAADRLTAAAPRFHLFADVYACRSYDAEYRDLTTRWLARRQDRLLSCNVLVGATVVARGVAIANLALENPLQTYSSLRAFEAALAAANGGVSLHAPLRG